ncbi:hypothetical protein RCH14_004478 [Massilia sp. MP_M2]|uniref:ATP-binding protein n=1 Tax=Massilia sp. MP_M2 TaxID=3071713 RepID=UPI00319E40A6
MPFAIDSKILVATTCAGLASDRRSAESRLQRNDESEHLIRNEDALSTADVEDLRAAAESLDAGKVVRTLDAMLLARAGNFSRPVPNFNAFYATLLSYLKHELQDGWIYVEHDDGMVYPELVTSVVHSAVTRDRDTPTVTVHTTYYGRTQSNRIGVCKNSHRFDPQDVARRRIADTLRNAGIQKESSALRADYDSALKRHHEVTADAFAKQFRLNGVAAGIEGDNRARLENRKFENRKVIFDLDKGSFGALQGFVDSELFDGHAEHPDVGSIPEHPIVKVFDLKTHDFVWANSAFLTPYQYDKSLRDKLILPASHRDLLDVLTTNLDAFINDIIEGKSAGNVVLNKGIPGVGKTLTAEVYAELIEKPLYSIHSGSLGTTARDIQKNLQILFDRAERWGCVMLLDEADVFVVKRGDNIEQNAIVAEFLRTLEYFNGLLFMTTNRPHDIDDAIISRCAAIIDYAPPDAKDAAAIWRVMDGQFKAGLSGDLITELVKLFPAIAPRDIKMLLRLALRVALGRGEALTLDTFRRCAMFRAIKMSEQHGKEIGHE